MKRLILNVLVLLLFLTGLFMVTVSASWASRLAGDQANYLSDDPNEQPVPECQLTNNLFIYLSENANQAKEDNILQE